MEKSRSFPSAGYSTNFGYDDEPEKNNSYSFNGPRSGPSDPELKRKRRVASYNVFTMEGKLKSSVRSSFKWIKSKFSDLR
ncbi:uncharacterized protein LOC110092160 [Dendrobium catenatum]|uniref:Uncharacterized protein n=3 Tax=Dendrobium TaxID=37818 RepID=A0A8T3BJC4_DENNO|nr:uncharacterized protein LOC110092160 [Dendrobium catenatum]KAH0460954.1 hypothetical protein IEQ34_008529 [Dendrobium chrysotoxum]KAI0512347.1 hypothetical protein KFK09_012986 [Dendrobium nobile]PKU77771.1 hypothetical protein MA16_Dca005603 [Dendrobium catenatum]